MSTKWPEKKCLNCGKEIRLVRTKYGWKAYEVEDFHPHTCGADVYDLPDNRRKNIFNPKCSKFSNHGH